MVQSVTSLLSTFGEIPIRIQDKELEHRSTKTG